MQRRVVSDRKDPTARACEGKLAFDFAGGRRAIRRMVRQGERGVQLYSCHACQAFHIGGGEPRHHRRNRARRPSRMAD